MPQPLLRVKNIRQTTWGPIALEQNPKLAALIMKYIATWSQAEIGLGNLLAVALGLERNTAFAAVQMYLRLTSADARRSVLDAAAHAMLDRTDYRLFTLTMRALRPIRSRRNDFAHGYWGMSPELDDALLWIGADDHIVYDAIMSGTQPKHPSLGLTNALSIAADAHRQRWDSIMVYRLKDLSDDLTNVQAGTDLITLLWLILHPGAQALRDARRQDLYNRRLIQAVVQSETNPENSSESPPSPPPENPSEKA